MMKKLLVMLCVVFMYACTSEEDGYGSDTYSTKAKLVHLNGF